VHNPTSTQQQQPGFKMASTGHAHISQPIRIEHKVGATLNFYIYGSWFTKISISDHKFGKHYFNK